ncbi:DUF3226 domain-containing protein [Vibrio marisflavi]|uniref:DUF4435 domain-containing protein n=1 Tax=Vibrio marisflavi CECT 7928 TaxID=634439 RepID=A0ABM9A4J4_9VIBR|nr:DUF3226 domain-containing protein [Vibrio marisflavi]CAH0539808.1 hypothetical protein VMF7928_02465 [Vibrio marisflavi CECT 7928]
MNKLMLVEGKDEVGFFKEFLRKKNIEGIRIREVGGKDKIKSELKVVLQERGIEDLETLIVVQDADNSKASALQSLKATFSNLGLPVPDSDLEFRKNGKHPFKCGFYIMPGVDEQGMLEDLLLSSCTQETVKEEAIKYIERIEELSNERNDVKKPRNMAKAKLHAYLSGLEKHKPNIGLAVKASCFNLDSNKFDGLTTFLNDA